MVVARIRSIIGRFMEFFTVKLIGFMYSRKPEMSVCSALSA